MQMYRYFIELSFLGTHYCGWQIQPNAETVQGVIDRSLSLLLGETIETTGCGRTDTGVHARYFVAHFDSKQFDLHTNTAFFKKWNLFLPPDIRIISVKRVHSTAHARFDATLRSYEYHINCQKDPFRLQTSYYFGRKLNVQLMNEACQFLLKIDDFSSFCRTHTDVKTHICHLQRIEWVEQGESLIFYISADRFLRNMVRAIVGTLLNLGLGKISLEEFEEIVRQKNRCKAGQSAPAKGLFLTDVQYPYPDFK